MPWKLSGVLYSEEEVVEMKNQYETELNNLKTKLEDKSQESERLREEVLELRKSLATLQSLLKPAMENIQHVLSSPPSPPPDSGGAGQDGREEGAGSLSGDHQGRPGPPKKIYASDFDGESFNLSWSAPTDTGDSPITNYIVEKCEVSGSFMKVSSYITTCYTRIRNLTVGSNYHFKIYAENQYGVSDPAQTDEPITAKHPFDPPGAPGQPRDTASTSDSISIQWTRPRSDGGSTILGYYIEKKIAGGNWTKAGHAMVSDLNQKVTGLQENKNYEFKVAAVNAAGQGSWSPPSDPIRCSPARCAPKITSDLSLRDMTIVAGHDISITVPFTAAPQPKAYWSINGCEVSSDTRVNLELSQHEARFYNKKSKRADTGTYNIQLTNSEGSAQASCKVNVVDRPSLSGQQPVPKTGPALEGPQQGQEAQQEAQQDGQPGLGELGGAHQVVLQGGGPDHPLTPPATPGEKRSKPFSPEPPEKYLTEPKLTPKYLITIAVRNLDPQNKGASFGQIVAFISLHFPYYDVNYDICVRAVKKAFNRNPDVEVEPSKLFCVDGIEDGIERLYAKISPVLTNSKQDIEKSMLHPKFLDLMVERFVKGEKYQHPKQDSQSPYSSQQLAFLALSGLKTPVNIEQIIIYLQFLFPSFTSLQAEFKKKFLSDLCKLEEIESVQKGQEVRYRLHPEHCATVLKDIRSFTAEKNNFHQLRMSVFNEDFIAVLFPGLEISDGELEIPEAEVGDEGPEMPEPEVDDGQNEMPEDLHSLTVRELRNLLLKAGLVRKGNKAVLIERLLLNTRHSLPDWRAEVNEMLISIYTAMVTALDSEGRCYADSLKELAEQDEMGGSKVQALSLEIIKRRVDRGLYGRLDLLQRDVLLVLNRARRLSRTDSQVWEDSVELTRRFFKARDEITEGGARLQSEALLLTLEKVERDLQAAKDAEPTTEVGSSDSSMMETQDTLVTEVEDVGWVVAEDTDVSPEDGLTYWDQITIPRSTMLTTGDYDLVRRGDYVLVRGENNRDIIAHIEKLWTGSKPVLTLQYDISFNNSRQREYCPFCWP